MQTLTRRLLAFAIASCYVFGSAALPASAQSDTGAVVVTVDTAGTGANAVNVKVTDARVTLLGPSVASALTTKSGIVKYTDVPVGIYRVRVIKSGFQAQTSEEFQINPNREVDVTITLSTSGPRIIGTVVARPSIDITSRDVDADSPIRRLSDSLTDALDKLAGVSVTQDSNDPNAAQTVSLRNKDESQTSVTLDGIPLGPAGGAVNLRAIGTDLFGGASTSFGPSAAGLGGGVNFRTLQPTQTRQEVASLSYGTLDRVTYSLGQTGSIGKLGYAILHTDRSAINQLTFQNYLDQSGIAYDHGGESKSLGDFAKLRYGFNDARTTLNGTFLQNNASSSNLCTQNVTAVPCGSGPGNTSGSGFHLGSFQVQSLIGEISTSLSAYATANASVSDNNNRFVVGTYSPLSSYTATSARGIVLNGTISRGKHTITGNATTYASRTDFLPSVPNQFFVASSSAVHSSNYGLQDSYKVNDRLSLGENVSLASVTGAGPSILGGVSAQWKPNTADSFNASLSLGSAQPAAGLVRTFSDPSNARFNCQAGTTNVSGPGDLAGKQSSTSYDLRWSHQQGPLAFSVSLFRQAQAGQLVNAAIQTPAALLPAGYIPVLSQLWNNPLVCGSTATFDPNQIFVSEPIGGTQRVYQGVDISGRFALGKYLTVLPTYSSDAAVLTAASSLLQGANSTTIIGQQLPGRPVHRGGVTVDGLIPKLATELLANVQYTGGNNNAHLGAYATAAFGITHPLGAGKITLFETNAFNTDTAPFSSLLYSQALATSGGKQVAIAANPIAARAYTLSYSVRLGNVASATRSQAAAAAAAAAGARNNRQAAFPPPQGTDPLALATARTSCTADAQALAAPQLTALTAYLTGVKTNAKLAPPKGVATTIHGDPSAGDAWYVEVRPDIPGGGAAAGANRGAGGFGGGARNRGEGGDGPPGGGFGAAPAAPRATPSPEVQKLFAAYRAFIGCTYVTALDAPAAKARGIDTARPSFGYAPTIGFFFVRPPELGSGGGSVKQ